MNDSAAGVPPASPLPDPWKDFPLFDEGDALDRTGGDRPFLGELLGLFLEAHREDPLRLRHLATEGAWDDAIIGAHALKGAAGNLGFRRLMEQARWVERTLKNAPRTGSEPFPSGMVRDLARTLDTTLSLAQTLEIRFQAPSP